MIHASNFHYEFVTLSMVSVSTDLHTDYAKALTGLNNCDLPIDNQYYMDETLTNFCTIYFDQPVLAENSCGIILRALNE